MTGKNLLLIGAGSLVGYGVLHLLNPSVFGWKEQEWLPFYSPARAADIEASHNKLNVLALAGVGLVVTILVTKNSQ